MTAALDIQDLGGALLSDINLSIPAGQCVCLQGPSGAGKSQLLRAIADLDPHQGRVSLGGIAASEIAPAEWRRRVALVPSESAWWADRVGDHFASVVPGVLSALNFSPSVLDWSIARLSSGERQRLALARALSRKPDALLLDEPTANLDTANMRRVEALVAEYRVQQAVPVIWVSHDPAQAERVAQRICRLRDGRLEEACR